MQLRSSWLLSSAGVGTVCEQPVIDESLADDDDDEQAVFYDDVSGAPLSAELVRKGREEELEIIDNLGVWQEVSLQ